MLKKTFALLLLVFSLGANAQLQIPPLTDPVIDQAGLINREDREILRGLIFAFHQRGKGQVQVLTLKTLGDLPIEQASIQILDRWKLGDKKRDDGVLILVSAQERKMRIEVGQGLEGVLTDIRAKQIIEEVMVPVFRKSSPSEGILAGTVAVMREIDPTFQPGSQVPVRSESSRGGGSRYEGLFILIFILFMIFGNLFRPRRRSFWGGGWGGGGWGSGGGFGGGGSGWGGGGGGFSGGGASGNW